MDKKKKSSSGKRKSQIDEDRSQKKQKTKSEPPPEYAIEIPSDSPVVFHEAAMSGELDKKSDTYIDDLITLYFTRYKNDPLRFRKHVEAFQDEDGKFTLTAFTHKWKLLTNDDPLTTRIACGLTYNACAQDKEITAASCTGRLKHVYDTGIVNRDMSINEKNLKSTMKSVFKYDPEVKNQVTTLKELLENVDKCIKRDGPDHKMPYHGVESYLVTYERVAKGEMENMIKAYSDVIITRSDEKIAGITAETFIQFYFESDVLNTKVMRGELPIKIEHRKSSGWCNIL
jgi:hypothetical protein